MAEEERCLLQPIDDAVKNLTDIKEYLDNIFIDLEGKGQDYIDAKIVNTINPMINKKLAEIRQKTIKSCQGMYKDLQALKAMFEPIESADPTDLGSVISFCKNVKQVLIGAYEDMMAILDLLPSHLADLTSAVLDIVSYSPPLQGINFDKLDIHMEPITMADITG